MRPMRSTLTVLVVLAVAVPGPRTAFAGQGGTPPPVAEESSPAPTVSLDVLGSQATGGGQALWLIRLVFAPEASLAFRVNPGATVAQVEAGEVAFTVVVGTAWIRNANDSSAAAYRADLGAETVLGPDATVSFGADALHLFRNAGSLPTSVLLTAVAPADQPPYGQAVSTDGQPVVTSDALAPPRPE